MVNDMRIAFVGKGGSGKTTVASLFARYLAEKNLPVLAIDADINQHLAAALGFSEEEAASIPPLGAEMNRIKEYLRGENPRIRSNAVMIKTTPPGGGSRFLRLTEYNPLSRYFERNVSGVRLMAVGEFAEEDLGVKCYHSKVGAVELILNHLIDEKKEYVVVDMTAGADAFASGLFTKFDLTLLIVEPTLRSIGVYTQYKNYAKDHQLNIKVIGNKIEDEDDVAFIKAHVGDDLLVVLKKSDFIRSSEKGSQPPLKRLEAENRHALESIIQTIDDIRKDWKKFYDDAILFARKKCRGLGQRSGRRKPCLTNRPLVQH